MGKKKRAHVTVRQVQFSVITARMTLLDSTGTQQLSLVEIF
jgi:hypothetical protein